MHTHMPARNNDKISYYVAYKGTQMTYRNRSKINRRPGKELAFQISTKRYDACKQRFPFIVHN